MDVVEFLTALLGFIPLWAAVTITHTNKSISRKTEFETTPHRDFYRKTEVTVRALNSYQNLVYSTMIGDKDAKYPVGYSDFFNQTVFRYNLQRTLTDSIQLATHYYTPNTYKEQVFYSFSGIRELMSVINLIIRYLDVFAKMLDVDNSITAKQIIRFKILQVLCVRYDVHPIEYALVKTIVNRLAKTIPHFGNSRDYGNFADYVENHIRFLGKEQIKRSLRDAVKVFWMDGVGCNSVTIDRDIRIIADPIDTLSSSPAGKILSEDFYFIDVVSDVSDLRLHCLNVGTLALIPKPFILKFKDFTMLPYLRSKAPIYSVFPAYFVNSLGKIFEEGIDAGEWVKYFFSKTRGTGYILFDERTADYLDYMRVKMNVDDLPIEHRSLFYEFQKCMGEIFL